MIVPEEHPVLGKRVKSWRVLGGHEIRSHAVPDYEDDMLGRGRPRNVTEKKRGNGDAGEMHGR